MPTPRPTLETVARAAGVSRQTVSNVLNAPHRVTPETTSLVKSVITELGYRPSLAARQLRTNRSNTLGMRLEPTHDGINGSVLDQFLHALVEAGEAVNHRLLLYTAARDDDELRCYEDLLSAHQLDGFVLTATHHGDPRTAWLAARRVPFSTFGRPWGASRRRHSWVDVDGAHGTEQAVAHLVEQGHRRIAFVGWPQGSGVGDDRREGWRRGLRAAGLPASTRAVGVLDRGVPDGVAPGTAEADRLLALTNPPTAFVCASDSLALGVLRSLDSTGRSAAVVGFDDTAIAAAVGITSVAQPVREAAQECLRQVLTAIAGDTRPSTALLAPRLVIRASSRQQL